VFDFAGLFLVAILVSVRIRETPVKVCGVCPRRQKIVGTALARQSELSLSLTDQPLNSPFGFRFSLEGVDP